MRTPNNDLEMIEEFKKKEKFIEEPYPVGYPGISDEQFRPVFTEKINLAASDFRRLQKEMNLQKLSITLPWTKV